MAARLKVFQILEAGNVALSAGIAAEARHREQVRLLLAEARFLRTNLPGAPREELRVSLETMLRRVDRAQENHRRQNWTIARLKELLQRAARCRNPIDAELDVGPKLYEILSPFIERGDMSDCMNGEQSLRRAARSGSITRDMIVGHLASLCTGPDRRV